MKNLIAIILCIVFSICCTYAQDCAFIFDKLPIIQKDTVMTWKGLKPVFIESGEEVEVTVTFKVKTPPVPVVTVVNNTELTYSGIWEHWTNGVISISYSITVGATAKYSFTGNRIEVVSDLAPGHGVFSWTIDGIPQENVNLYRATRLNGQTVIEKDIPAGYHTIILTVVSNTVLIDKLIVTK